MGIRLFGLLSPAPRRGQAPAAAIEQEQEGGQQDAPGADGDVEPELEGAPHLSSVQHILAHAPLFLHDFSDAPP